MEKRFGIFQDSNGNFSIMRVAFAWLMVNATAMAWFTLLTTEGVGAAAAIFGTISGVATGLKIMQNNQEKKG